MKRPRAPPGGRGHGKRLVSELSEVSPRKITVRLPSLWKGSARERSKALILVNPRDEKREALAGENAKAFGSDI